MGKKRSLWKRMVSLLLAFLLIVSALPVKDAGEAKAAALDNSTAGSLTNIASGCEITVPDAEHPASNMVDGDTTTLWVNNGAVWPCTAAFELPKANTKCVKKVVLKFESGHTAWGVDVKLQYALNNITSDLITPEGSAKTVASFDDGYEYVFETPQSMTHLYITLDNPKNNGAAGGFWPAIAEAEIYVDNGAEEEVVLENLLISNAKIVLEESVNQTADKRRLADGDFDTAVPLHTRTLSEIADGGTLPFAEAVFGVNQRVRGFVLAMGQDSTGAEYRYTIYGRTKEENKYAAVTSGTIGTGRENAKAELSVSDLTSDGAKEAEYEAVKVVFEAANEAAGNTIPKLAELQVLANKAAIVEADTENIVWGSTALHSNYSQNTLDRIVDGNTKNTWTATQYPAYVDIELDGEYELSEIEVYTPSNGYSQYSLYYSADGQNYSKLAEKTGKESCGEEGESYDAAGVTASSVRVLLEYNSAGAQAVLNEVRIMGTRKGEAKKASFEAPVSYEDSDYNVDVTGQDTIDEVKGIVERNLGEKYVDWFTFALGEKGDYDYYDIEDADGKICITGNNGVSIASGLNHYLKYYCQVSITQVGNQVKMPDSIVPVGEKVHKECKVPVRYAYNYCTMSYSMPFWGEAEWRKELDWLALNGVNLVLDITGQEEVWRRFLGTLGYDHASIKDYIAGPAYYAWAYMANLSGYGGPVHDSWFEERTELARKNQLIMRKLGMQPILQGYSGMVPVDIVEKAQGDYALAGNDVIAQGNWCSYQRPYMLRTTSAVYDKYAELFYECQREVFGDVTDYYATDPFHEGGNTGGMNSSLISSNVIDSLIQFDSKAVWVIQAWQGNPTAALMNGLEGNREHALVLDLYAEKTPHWNEANYAGGREFQKTPWVYCMLNNFGGRMGLHGHMDNLVSGIVEAANTAEKLTGIGITPEGSQNNPVLYDLLFETVWCEDASQELEAIDTETWLRNYVNRRYGAESENAYQAMRILEDTVYKASLNMLGQGAPESYVNARPADSISAASTWGNAVISYDMEKLEDAAKLLLKDYDVLKESDGYLYDLADILKQILSNASQKYHRQMISAKNARDLEKFTEASDQFLNLIDKVNEVLGTRKEFLLGTWVEQAKALAANADDFSKDLYEFNAKSLVTTWGAYPQANSGGLKDYSNRQWAGLTKDFYKQRWSMWIENQKKTLAGESAEAINWFEFEWAWARANTPYTTEASGADLKTLGLDILKNYSSVDRSPEADPSNDYPVGDLTVTAGSEETSGENAPAVNVLDGDTSTFWHTNWSTGSDSSSFERHYLIFTLKEEAEVAGVRYLPRQDASTNGILTQYEIYVSTDGTDFTKVSEGTWAGDKAWKLASFSPVYAKYVKLVSIGAMTAETGKCFTTAAEVRITVPRRPVLTESITIHAEKTTLKAGESLQLTAEITPEDVDDSTLSWSSSDPAIASVDESGSVTAVAEGKAVIRAEAADGSGVSGEIELTVIKNEKQEAEEAKQELKNTLDRMGTKIEKNYTPNTWEAYEKALQEAKKLMADPEAKKEQILAAKAALEQAEKALVKAVVDTLPKKGYVYKTSTLVYKVTVSNPKVRKVTVVKPAKKTCKKISIPSTVKINGYVYQVTEISAKAFRNCKKLDQVVIGKNVAKIGKQAFDGCKALKKITIKAAALKKIYKYAFRNIKKNAKIYVPKKKYTAYKKQILKAKTAKSVKILKK